MLHKKTTEQVFDILYIAKMNSFVTVVTFILLYDLKNQIIELHRRTNF